MEVMKVMLLRGIKDAISVESVWIDRMFSLVFDRVFYSEVSISAHRLDLGFKSQQILILARARSIWDFQPPGAKARAMAVDFSDALDVKSVR
jgi:hypothetical protein